MRISARLTSAKLTLFFRSSTAGWTTDGKYLVGAEFSLHGKKITPRPFTRMVNLEQLWQLLASAARPYEKGAKPRLRDCGMGRKSICHESPFSAALARFASYCLPAFEQNERDYEQSRNRVCPLDVPDGVDRQSRQGDQ
jgi:hypothetical protein